MVTAMTDQWTLNRLNFEGCWQGRSEWFGRDRSGALDLVAPQRVIDPTTYAISFSDPDTGVWDGSGLFFAPDGHATYAICRSSYNFGGGCWQFPAAGGQSSLRLNANAKRFGHEINLFHGRSRTMLVLIWELEEPSRWCLNAVGAVGFRCRHASTAEPERPKCGTLQELLTPMAGWSGRVERLKPQPGVDGQVEARGIELFRPDQLLRHDCSAVLSDGLVFSVPEQLPQGAFQLQIGARLAANLFQQISIVFDAEGRLKAWERRSFQPQPA